MVVVVGARARAAAVRRHGGQLLSRQRRLVPVAPAPALRVAHDAAGAHDPPEQQEAGDGPDDDARDGAAAEHAAARGGPVCDDRGGFLPRCEDFCYGLGEGPRRLKRGCECDGWRHFLGE